MIPKPDPGYVSFADDRSREIDRREKDPPLRDEPALIAAKIRTAIEIAQGMNLHRLSTSPVMRRHMQQQELAWLRSGAWELDWMACGCDPESMWWHLRKLGLVP